MDDIIEELKCISKIKPGDTYSTSARECIPRTAWSTTIYKRICGSYEHRYQMVDDLKKLQRKIETYPYDSRDIRNQKMIDAIVAATGGLNTLADNYCDDMTTADNIRDIVAALLLQKSLIWNKYVKDIEIIAAVTPPCPVMSSPSLSSASISSSPISTSLYSSSAPQPSTLQNMNVGSLKEPSTLQNMNVGSVQNIVIPTDEQLMKVSSQIPDSDFKKVSIDMTKTDSLSTFKDSEIPTLTEFKGPITNLNDTDVKKSTVQSIQPVSSTSESSRRGRRKYK